MDAADTALPRFASVGFVAHLADVSPQTVRNYCKAGLIKPSAWLHRTEEVGPQAIFSTADLLGVVEEVRRISRINAALATVTPPVEPIS